MLTSVIEYTLGIVTLWLPCPMEFRTLCPHYTQMLQQPTCRLVCNITGQNGLGRECPWCAHKGITGCFGNSSVPHWKYNPHVFWQRQKLWIRVTLKPRCCNYDSAQILTIYSGLTGNFMKLHLSILMECYTIMQSNIIHRSGRMAKTGKVCVHKHRWTPGGHRRHTQDTDVEGLNDLWKQQREIRN